MSNPPFLIVGLGNPGTKYEKTRHNFGFLVVDEIIKRHDAVSSNTKLQTKLWTAKASGATILLAEPQTFMNLSGNAVAPLTRAKKIIPEHLIVVHDDLDLPLGTIRVSRGASAGGHNGVQSIIDALGTKDFIRVRMGIGRPTNDQAIEDFVLTRFSAEEKKMLPEVIDKAINETISLISVIPAKAGIQKQRG
jgi:peptidyl-tRNA hydrolase, PTH1 family